MQKSPKLYSYHHHALWLIHTKVYNRIADSLQLRKVASVGGNFAITSSRDDQLAWSDVKCAIPAV